MSIPPSHSYVLKVKAILFYTQNNNSQHEIDKMSAQAAHKKVTISHADILDYMPYMPTYIPDNKGRDMMPAIPLSITYLSLCMRSNSYKWI